MVEARLLGLIPHLPDGVSEIYLHPATHCSASFVAANGSHRRPDELAALLSPFVRDRIAASGVRLTTYTDL